LIRKKTEIMKTAIRFILAAHLPALATPMLMEITQYPSQYPSSTSLIVRYICALHPQELRRIVSIRQFHISFIHGDWKDMELDWVIGWIAGKPRCGDIRRVTMLMERRCDGHISTTSVSAVAKSCWTLYPDLSLIPGRHAVRSK
jgi:hypothetical protein